MFEKIVYKCVSTKMDLHLTFATLLFLSITMAFAQISSSIASHFRKTWPKWVWNTTNNSFAKKQEILFSGVKLWFLTDRCLLLKLGQIDPILLHFAFDCCIWFNIVAFYLFNMILVEFLFRIPSVILETSNSDLLFQFKKGTENMRWSK